MLVGCISVIAAPWASADVLLSLGLTGTPNPVAPGQKIEYAVSVSNRGTSNTGLFTVSAIVPPYTSVNAAYDAPGHYNGGCAYSPGTCLPGQAISWNVNLAPGASTTLRYSALVGSATPPPNGTGFTATATTTYGSTTLNVTSDAVIDSRPLPELGLSDSPNVVAAGATLTYTLSYGNPTAGAVNAALRLPLPTGTTFVSASDGGSLTSGVVQWSLGSLAAGASGQRQVSVQVAAGTASGTQIAASADLRDSATQQSFARAVRVSTVSTAAADPVLLSMSATPNPVAPGQKIEYAISVSNVGSSNTGNFTVDAIVPPYTSVDTGYDAPGHYNGGCAYYLGTCLPGQTISWNVNLTPGASTTLRYSALVDSTNPPPNGSIISASASALGYPGAESEVDVRVTGGSSPTPGADGDVPIPAWALTLLASGLLGSIGRRVRK
jgi:uncharacterized repeat protein (TIGR01451 family)